MILKIIECVPNFSEGKKDETFVAIKNSINKTEGVKLLNFEPDADYNRVVVTLAGGENGIIEGAINACKAAAENIDMRNHKGEHPRLGAIDVVPFIPVKNVTTDDCVRISEEFGKRIAKELNLPVYLYEASARKPERSNLSNIRKGEYEGLEEKLKDVQWTPDFGEAVFNPKLGALVTGARFFLIAYNVNIKSTDTKYSKKIAEVLRESGKPKKDEENKIIKVDGKTVRIPGRLKNVKGMGVALEKHNITQVSMNLTNYTVTPMHVAFEEVKREADRLGVEVMGSEVVGLVPLDAMILAGKYYSENESTKENELVDLAIEKLELNSITPFEKDKKIIEYMIKD